METMKESFTTIMAGLEERMTNFEEELKKSGKNPSSAPSLASLTSDFAAFKAFVVGILSAFRQQVDFLARQVDNLELRSRREMLLLHGVPEREAEDTAQTVVSAIKDHLKFGDLSVVDIRRCHRMGRPLGAGKSRPILVKFQHMAVRDKIWFTKAKLKGSGITLSEFVTRTRHEVFMAARERFGISRCWTREGHVYVLGTDGARHRVATLGELNQLNLSSQKPPAEKIPISSKPRRAAKK